MPRSSSASRLLLSLATAAALLPGVAHAQGTVVLQNDSVSDFGMVAIQAGFVAGERGGVWLTSPCAGQLTAVRVLWLASPPNGGSTLGESIRISQAGSFPQPGGVLRELLGPNMVEGGFNEFTLAPALAIAQGETVVVDFQFLASPPAGGPSLVTDIDGCQPGRNAVYATPPNQWLDLCLFGVAGDLAIRAVAECASSSVFADGFESGDTSEWSATVP